MKVRRLSLWKVIFQDLFPALRGSAHLTPTMARIRVKKKLKAISPYKLYGHLPDTVDLRTNCMEDLHDDEPPYKLYHHQRNVDKSIWGEHDRLHYYTCFVTWPQITLGLDQWNHYVWARASFAYVQQQLVVKGRYLKYTKILLIIVLKPYGGADSTWRCHTNKNNNNMAASNVRK